MVLRHIAHEIKHLCESSLLINNRRQLVKVNQSKFSKSQVYSSYILYDMLMNTDPAQHSCFTPIQPPKGLKLPPNMLE